MPAIFIVLLVLPGFMDLTQIYRGQRLLNVVMATSRQTSVHTLVSEIERFRAQTGQYPASLAALASRDGFEYARGFIATPGIGYALTTSVSDSVWNYDRAMIAGIDTTHTSLTSFLTLNSCGSGDFSTASDWCGSSQFGDWYKTESRTVFAKEAAVARERLNQTLMKFVAVWNASGAFPTGSLSAGSSASLASIVGTALTASTCTGTFTLGGVPLECGDIFNIWGGNVIYTYINASYIAITADTPFTYSAGGSQHVAAEMHY